MRALLLIVFFVGLAACGEDKAPYVEPPDLEARAEFPDVQRLYDGDHGIYRGCGPNGNVCHNGNEFPNLDSIGSIVDGIGRDCNQKRDKADALHDMCERVGDILEFKLPDGPDADTALDLEYIEVAYIVPVEGSGSPPTQFKMTMRRAPTDFAVTYQSMPATRGGEFTANVGDLSANRVIDPDDASGKTIILTMYASSFGQQVAGRLLKAGIPGVTETVFVGDPNRNGTFGAELGGKLIKPGDPQRSYLLRRLTDPTAGPLMPRANCCFWTKPALRALWCWVAGLEPDGGNAMAKIDYDNCPPSPAVELGYPDPTEGCETAGMCPPLAIGGTNEPTFRSVYAEILVPKCGGSGCHDQEPFGGDINMSDELSAYDTLAPKVVPGNAAASTLVIKLRPETCQAPCTTMPLDRPLLPDADVDRIRQWIADGALP
jgi:hypothetical protein